MNDQQPSSGNRWEQAHEAAPAPPASAAAPESAPARSRSRRGAPRRVRVLGAAGALALVLVGAAGGYAVERTVGHHDAPFGQGDDRVGPRGDDAGGRQ